MEATDTTAELERMRKNPIGVIGLEEAAEILQCSSQWLGKTLKKEEHQICRHFRHYAGRYRTTIHLLAEYFIDNPDNY